MEDQMEVFEDYAYYYNAFYQDKDYKAEAKQIDLLLQKYGQNIKKIINYGCGTGRHDIELSKLGYHCTGIDLSPLMIDIAKKHMLQEEHLIDFSVADVRNYQPTETYDSVISLFHVMSYQTGNEDILAAFESARRALDTGGIFLFDVWYGSGVLTDKPVVRVKKVEDDKYSLIRIAKPVMYEKRNVVDVCYEVLVVDKADMTVKTIHETHSMRYFFRPELEYYLKQTGFELIDHVDCSTLAETDFTSWTSYFVAKAV